MRAEKREEEPSNIKEIETRRSTFIYPGAANDSLLLNESPAVCKGPYNCSRAAANRKMDVPSFNELCGPSDL
ncbi:unnamed protein product [Spirodela intermedia]|uniref:Uncharacterized protein n=2 Tax=Spirodela intermedia TaxID=51605 RepID=A0A7I8KYZ7_SPIIN|nr:unnamed protein product [Spirodela intermedia]CAA6665488.1 unnamed protein product [Spirodela intermedia]CAA7402225.1 unnamed protein product [Spirodela intermedia]